ncbi:MAG TPA: glycosyltransferase [Flavobacterium sp.]|jgi:glycosyltransferase involved in cell wall biosynthesis
MRIVQLIDSLAAGGAERMAVNYANAVAKKGFSALVSTRQQGPLVAEISQNVVYLHLNRQKKADFKAVSVLRNFCIKHRIEIVHAHGTSYFFAVLLKLTLPSIKIIWHDHFGFRDQQQVKENKMLWLCARFFTGAIVVNKALAAWSIAKLKLKQVIYLPNFTVLPEVNAPAFLPGQHGKRIVYVANLRDPKNHMIVVKAAAEVAKMHHDWTFHFIGKDYNDDYSNRLRNAISEMKLEGSVFIHGQRNDIKAIIAACEIGLIASDFEGLPISLLEYGICGIAVVSTAVGHIPEIINSKTGILIEIGSEEQMTNGITKLIADADLRMHLAAGLKETVLSGYSELTVMDTYTKWLSAL